MLSMLPIFIIGVVIGVALEYAWFVYKRDTPSQIKLEAQEFTINSQKNDIKLLTKLNEKLYKQIESLKEKNKKE